MTKLSDEKRQDLLRKAEKLLRFTKENGCTEGEINNAADKIGEILRETDLTMDDIRVSTIKTDIVTESSMHEFGRIQEWEWEMFMAIAKVCSCRVYTFTKKTVENGKKIKTRTFKIVGTESDAMVCKYFCDCLMNALPPMAEKYCDNQTYFDRAGRLAIRTSYLKGLTDTVAERIERMVRPSTVTKEVSERGLSLVNNKLIAVDEKIKEEHPKMRSVKIRWTEAKADHYGEGKKDGHNVGLNLGIARSTPSGHIA
jgi:hypothetical protein